MTGGRLAPTPTWIARLAWRGRGASFAFLQGRFGGERPGAAGVTEEHLPGPETARFPVGRSPTRPMSH